MTNFTRLITDWYRLNKRDLPWRNTINPYFIWLSEIILQQTRIEQGKSYYSKLINKYPTVHDLATASETEILNDWQGLGYYSRARNLHATAKIISTKYKGEFPSDYKTILQLKGIGTYTAAAISSFAFKNVNAVVDGNVYRLLSRVFDINTPIDSSQGRKEFQLLADELISKKEPDIHNQAIMEVGSIVCTPKNPNCSDCPLSEMCLSKQNNSIEKRPVKSIKTKVSNKTFHFLIFSEEGKTIIEKRVNKGIWQNMYQFPLTELKKEIPKKNLRHVSTEITHILSHQKIKAYFYHYDKLPEKLKENWELIQIKNIQEFPIPRLIDRYLEKNEI